MSKTQALIVQIESLFIRPCWSESIGQSILGPQRTLHLFYQFLGLFRFFRFAIDLGVAMSVDGHIRRIAQESERYLERLLSRSLLLFSFEVFLGFFLGSCLEVSFHVLLNLGKRRDLELAVELVGQRRLFW